MRGLSARPTPAGGRDHERGVSLALVALAMTVIMGMASLAIDIGQGYWARRSLIPATDAAALAAAQDYAKGGNGCTSTAGTYLTQNDAAATLVGCVPYNYNTTQGRVTVTATKPVSTSFGKVLGFGNYTVRSVTTAGWSPPAGVTGVRPMGVCGLSNTTIANLLTSTANVDTTVTVTYGNTGNACGSASGNWGMIDFGASSNSNKDTNDLIRNGWLDNAVTFENHVVTSCTGDAHCRHGDTGVLSNSNASALNTLIANQTWFGVPIYNYVSGSGANAQFHIVGILRAQLVSHSLNGTARNRSLTFRFRPGLLTGTFGGTEVDGGNKVIAICGVDAGSYGACDPSDDDDDDDHDH